MEMLPDDQTALVIKRNHRASVMTRSYGNQPCARPRSGTVPHLSILRFVRSLTEDLISREPAAAQRRRFTDCGAASWQQLVAPAAVVVLFSNTSFVASKQRVLANLHRLKTRLSRPAESSALTGRVCNFRAIIPALGSAHVPTQD